jgi:hypothetical protein
MIVIRSIKIVFLKKFVHATLYKQLILVLACSLGNLGQLILLLQTNNNHIIITNALLYFYQHIFHIYI